MDRPLETLVDSLLYEGYALYPYTPGATKNATPTPFGIVYPPAYAEGNPATFDHLRAEALLEAPEGASISGAVRFLQADGKRHQAAQRGLELGPATLAELAGDGVGTEFELAGAETVSGRARLRADLLAGDRARVRLCVHNTTPAPPEMERSEALRHSLMSTLVVIETSAGRFVSPLEPAAAECRSVNTFPVLANPDDTAILGAAFVLPDHPAMAPESLGNLFDNTEIEEALLLHVHALSDSEREEIAGQDEAVRGMVARAQATTPEEIMQLHGRLEEITPDEPPQQRRNFAFGSEEPGHPNPGEAEVRTERGTVRKGAKVVLRPAPGGRDVYDTLLAGRTATVERIYFDYDDQVHVGVTVDGDASQELFRETGRYIFFKGSEVEPL
jgi:hypothetical protein